MKYFLSNMISDYKKANSLEKIGVISDICTIAGIPTLFIILKYTLQYFVNIDMSFKDIIMTILIVLAWFYFLFFSIDYVIRCYRESFRKNSSLAGTMALIGYLMLPCIVLYFLFNVHCFIVELLGVELFRPNPASKSIQTITIKEDNDTILSGKIQFVRNIKATNYVIVVYQSDETGLHLYEINGYHDRLFDIDEDGYFIIPKNDKYKKDSKEIYICILRNKDVSGIRKMVTEYRLPVSLISIKDRELGNLRPYIYLINRDIETGENTPQSRMALPPIR